MDIKLAKLKNGQTLELGNINGIRTFAEKSGKGDVIRFIREEKDSWRVYRTIHLPNIK